MRFSVQDERSREVIPFARRAKPASLDPSKNRTHVEPIPFVSPARQVNVTSLRRWVVLVEHYIDESLGRPFCVEGDLVALKFLRTFVDPFETSR